MASVTRFVRMSMSAAVLAALAFTEDDCLAIVTTGTAGFKLSLSTRRKAQEETLIEKKLSDAQKQNEDVLRLIDSLKNLAAMKKVDLAAWKKSSEELHKFLLWQDKHKINISKPEIYINKNLIYTNHRKHVIIPVSAEQTVGSPGQILTSGHYFIFFQDGRQDFLGTMYQGRQKWLSRDYVLVKPETKIAMTLGSHGGQANVSLSTVNSNIVADLKELGFKDAEKLVDLASASYQIKAEYALRLAESEQDLSPANWGPTSDTLLNKPRIISLLNELEFFYNGYLL